MKIIILSIIIFLSTCMFSFAGEMTVKFAWDANTEPIVIGYNMWRSESQGGPYTKLNEETIVGTTYSDVIKYPTKTTYYYVVTAVSETQSSDYSNEVNKFVNTAIILNGVRNLRIIYNEK